MSDATGFRVSPGVCRIFVCLSQQPQPKYGKKVGMSLKNVLSLHQKTEKSNN